MPIKKIQIWDLPLRVFHWLLVFTIAAAYVTAKFGGNLTEWHGRIGALALGLLIFRFSWGFVGSIHARFTSFFPTPSRLLAYLKGTWQSNGHNPLGALSVFALLSVLAVLIGTGLFANDDIAFQGPLFGLTSKSLSDELTGWHASSFNALLVLIILHLTAIAFYFFFKKTNLVKPMFTGSKEVVTTSTSTSISSEKTSVGKTRLLIAVTVAVIVVWFIFSGVLTEKLPNNISPVPVTPAQTSTPSW